MYIFEEADYEACFFPLAKRITAATAITGRHPKSPKQLGPRIDRWAFPLLSMNMRGIADEFIAACMSEGIQMQPVFS